MDTITALQSVEALLQPFSENTTRPEDIRLDAVVTPQNLKAAVSVLRNAHWGYLAAITGLDKPAATVDESSEPEENQIVILYHFCEGAAIATLRVSVPYSHPVVPTICDLIPSATLYERELMELFGVEVVGTPDPDRLILPDNWPQGVYPLRKSFKGFSQTPQEGKEE